MIIIAKHFRQHWAIWFPNFHIKIFFSSGAVSSSESYRCDEINCKVKYCVIDFMLSQFFKIKVSFFFPQLKGVWIICTLWMVWPRDEAKNEQKTHVYRHTFHIQRKQIAFYFWLETQDELCMDWKVLIGSATKWFSK